MTAIPMLWISPDSEFRRNRTSLDIPCLLSLNLFVGHLFSCRWKGEDPCVFRGADCFSSVLWGLFGSYLGGQIPGSSSGYSKACSKRAITILDIEVFALQNPSSGVLLFVSGPRSGSLSPVLSATVVMLKVELASSYIFVLQFTHIIVVMYSAAVCLVSLSFGCCILRPTTRCTTFATSQIFFPVVFFFALLGGSPSEKSQH